MPTIIDSLVIELGLDPRKFTAGQREAIKRAKEAAQEQKKLGDEAEQQAQKLNDIYGAVSRRLLAVGALLIGGRGLKEFAKNVNDDAAAVGYLSRSMGQSTVELSKWRGIVERTGGTVEGATQSIQGLSNDLQNFALTGESSVIPYLRALGVSVADEAGKMRPISEILLDIAGAVEKFDDPAKAGTMLRALGMDQGMINVLLQGRSAVEEMLREQARLSIVLDRQAVNAQKLQTSWTSLLQVIQAGARDLMTEATPFISKMLDTITKDLSTARAAPFSGMKDTTKESWLDALRKGLKWQPVENDPAKNGALEAAREELEQRMRAKKTIGGGFKSDPERETFIRSEASKLNLNPDVMVKVWQSEGKKAYTGDEGSSFGPFQLHYGGVSKKHSSIGLGDDFTKATGLDARDPATEQEQIKFTMQKVKEMGLGPWHGWKGDAWAAHKGGGSPGGAGDTQTTNIGTINIQTKATDADGIARDIRGALTNTGRASQAQGGPS